MASQNQIPLYSFHGSGGASKQLPIKQKKGTKGVSSHPFTFLRRMITKPKFKSAYFDELQLAISGTIHTNTTCENRVRRPDANTATNG